MKKLICLVLAVMLALFAVSAFAAEYTDKETVKKVQQALNDAGYDCGTPDGAAGKKTKAAITNYQTDKGLTVTGVIDDELLIALGLAEDEANEEAPAEAEAAEVEEGLPQIDFRGAKLGSTAAEALSVLGITSPLSDSMSTLPITVESISEYEPISLNGVYGKEYEAAVYNKFAFCDASFDDVAGYKPAWSQLFFIKSIQDGVVSDVMEESIFYGALYIFYDKDKSIEKDLVSKLTGIYGQPDKKGEKYVWNGANDTAITLNKVGFTELNLSYVWNGATPLIDEAIAISANEETPANTSTNGL